MYQSSDVHCCMWFFKDSTSHVDLFATLTLSQDSLYWSLWTVFEVPHVAEESPGMHHHITNSSCKPASCWSLGIGKRSQYAIHLVKISSRKLWKGKNLRELGLKIAFMQLIYKMSHKQLNLVSAIFLWQIPQQTENNNSKWNSCL